MDYSSDSDQIASDFGQSIEEPEIINETYQSVEPEFTESVQDTNAADNPVMDQGSIQADQEPTDADVTYHAQPNGIEVLPSPETEPLEGPAIRDWGAHDKGPGGSLEGGY